MAADLSFSDGRGVDGPTEVAPEPVEVDDADDGACRHFVDRVAIGDDGPFEADVPVPLPALREAYVQEVYALEGSAEDMRYEGADPETIARTLHGQRREIGILYKELTPPELLTKIHERNERVYGDPLGPSIEWLREQGRSWGDIIRSACTPGGADLGF